MIERSTCIRSALRARQRGFLLNPYRFGAGGGVPFGNVILLNNHQGANGSSTFTDASPVGRTLTRIGTPTLSTAQAIFGTSSAVFNGTDQAIDLGSGSEIQIEPTEYWAWEQWVRFTLGSYTGSPSSLQGITIVTNSGGNDYVQGGILYEAPDADPLRRYGGGDQNSATLGQAALTIAAGTWYYMQHVNDPVEDEFVFRIGTTPGSAATPYVTSAAKGLRFRYYGGAGQTLAYFDGYLGPIRIIEGALVDDTVPTGLFPES